MSLASSTALNSVTVRPTKPACSTRVYPIVMERFDRALEVDGELVTEREQLDADLVERDPVPAPSPVPAPALLGERRRDQRGGAADRRRQWRPPRAGSCGGRRAGSCLQSRSCLFDRCACSIGIGIWFRVQEQNVSFQVWFRSGNGLSTDSFGVCRTTERLSTPFCGAASGQKVKCPKALRQGVRRGVSPIIYISTWAASKGPEGGGQETATGICESDLPRAQPGQLPQRTL